jgi:hypothetical protein
MAVDLETLRKDVESFLEKEGVPVFFGEYGMFDTVHQVTWDVQSHPDFREFVAAGRQAGAPIFVFSYHALSLDQIDDAMEMLEDANLPREDQRNFETRLKQLEGYEGFTCSLDLSFRIDGQTYVYQRETDWYHDLNDILAELTALSQADQASDEDDLNNYFSKN